MSKQIETPSKLPNRGLEEDKSQVYQERGFGGNSSDTDAGRYLDKDNSCREKCFIEGIDSVLGL